MLGPLFFILRPPAAAMLGKETQMLFKNDILRTPGDGNGSDAGSGSGQDPTPPASTPEGDGNGTGQDANTFTQEQVNQIAADARSSARSKATKDFLGELGFEDADSLKSTLDSWKQHQDGQKSELEKAQEELQTLKGSDEKLKTLEGNYQKAMEVLQANVEAQMKALNIPEHIAALIKEKSPIEALEYLTKNADALKPVAPPDNDGNKGGNNGSGPQYDEAALRSKYGI